jgi:hypothetical protein
MANALAVIDTSETNAAIFRQSTDAASMCRDIVVQRAISLQGKRYVPIEGWQAIALAHGCIASAENVRMVDGGIAADGIIRRMRDGQEVARAEGFLGDDEKMWANRPMFARRAMAQTRAMSRACRSAFAHVVVMMDVGLETTPAEEMQGVYEIVPQEAPKRGSRAHKEAVAEARAVDVPEEELGAWKEWAKERAASLDMLDGEALAAMQNSQDFISAMAILDDHAPAYSERLRKRVLDRLEALEAQA